MFRTLRRLALLLPIGILCLYVFATARLYFTQTSLIFHPERDWIGTPEDFGLEYEDVSFEASDGVKLSGWYVPVENPRGTVLFFHGNSGNISREGLPVRQYHALGFDVFLFDCRGYGKSGGTITEAGMRLDADAGWDYLTRQRKIPPEKIVVIGRSFGAAVAIPLAVRHAPGALIAEAAFTSLGDIAAKFHPYFPVRLILRYRYDSLSEIKNVRCPTLVVHSREDQLVPFESGRRLFDAAAEPKDFLELTGLHDNKSDAVSQAAYVEGLAKFLDAVPSIPPAGPRPARGLFVSVLDEPEVFSSREEMEKLADFSAKAGIRTLFVQVYRANRAWFASKIADASPYESCLKNIGEDPLAFLIREAHARGIEVHAWLNLLSLSANETAPLLKKYGTSVLTRNQDKKQRVSDYKVDGQYFLEPGDPNVRRELSAIVEEVVTTYPGLDGIQFDYIRYPDKDPDYGYGTAGLFKKENSVRKVEKEDPQWKKWKRDQVTSLVDLLAANARSLHPGIQVSTTGLMPYSRAYHEAFQDWKSWVESGRIDFVTLMCYVKTAPEFERHLKDARRQFQDARKTNLAVGAYAFIDDAAAFGAQWGMCERSNVRECVALHYGSLQENPALGEIILKNADFPMDAGTQN